MLAIGGCIESAPSESVPDAIPFSAFDPIENPPTPFPDPFLNQEAETEAAANHEIVKEPVPKSAGYTGIRVFCDPDTCNPCRYLVCDLQFLRDKHGWTLSESSRVDANWQILPPRTSDRRIPLMEIWRHGLLCETLEGYVDSDFEEDRRPALKRLVAAHPLNDSKRNQ